MNLMNEFENELIISDRVIKDAERVVIPHHMKYTMGVLDRQLLRVKIAYSDLSDILKYEPEHEFLGGRRRALENRRHLLENVLMDIELAGHYV